MGIAEKTTAVLVFYARVTIKKSEALQNAVELLRGDKESLTENIGGFIRSRPKRYPAPIFIVSKNVIELIRK